MINEVKPKLDIIYSIIYDIHIHEWQGIPFKQWINVKQYKQEVIAKWKPIERKVFDTIKKISGLKWQKPIIDCYIVRKSISFSSPLTIRMMHDLNLQRMIIAHELVHKIIEQNPENVNLKYYSVKYANMHRRVKSHILHYAIFGSVLLEIFSKENAKKYMIWDKKKPLYRKAWDIVDEEGAENIIKKCIKIKNPASE